MVIKSLQNVRLHAGLIMLCLMAIALFTGSSLFAKALPLGLSPELQTLQLEGKVTDESGEALPGVNVMEKGTSNGTVTDADGRFRISVRSAQSTLVFSFVGTQTREVIVGNETVINVQMVLDATSLGEVVVIGYGTQERKDVTGAVATVKSGDFNRGIINTPEQLLQGKVAGVNVVSRSGEPGTSQSISIRGPGGVRTGSTPLFVVDGMALDNSGTGGAINPLNFLNPQDIESIDVLKDASATAIYGSRGANGVILITTKKGKAGSSSLSYNLDYGISKMARPIEVFTADEFRRNVTAIGGDLQDEGASTDWQKEVSRTAITQNHNVTLAGGVDRLRYYASVGMQDQEGIIKNSDLKRYSGRLNVSQQFLDDKVNVDLNLVATNTSNLRPPIESVIGGALSMNPTFPAYENGEPAIFENVVSPLTTLRLNKDITTTNRVIGNISPSVTILKGLVYKLNFGVDNSTSVRDLQSLPSVTPQQEGRFETISTRNSNSLIENYLTFSRSSGDHSYSILAGHSFQKFFIQQRGFSINRFPLSDIEPINNPGLGQDLTMTNNKPFGSTTRNELQSFFGRATYDFKARYLVTATLRTDGSSKFGDNNKYGTFPSFSLGWRLSEEQFLVNSGIISNLKIRAGWGKTGNQEIPSKITQALFTSQVSAGTTYPLADSPYPAGTTYARLANPDIQWEVSQQTNLGLDFGLMNDALSGSIDVFHKESNNILLEVIPSDPVQPAGTFWTNVKDMTIVNKGVELALNYTFRAANTLRFQVGGNVTLISNEVNNSPYTVIPSGNATGSGLTSATINGYVNGEPIGTFFLRRFTGFDENGLSVYADTDGDGVVGDKDRVAAGTALPSTLYNFQASVGFKGFDLAVNFNGASGNKVYDNTANANFYKLRLSKGLNTTNEAIASPEESVNNSAPVSTRFLKDGSFLRMNNISLGYTVSPSALGMERWISGIRFSVTGQNLLLFTKYDGYDPEVNTDRTINGVSSYGIDYQSYPKARTVMFSLNVTL